MFRQIVRHSKGFFKFYSPYNINLIARYLKIFIQGTYVHSIENALEHFILFVMHLKPTNVQ